MSYPAENMDKHANILYNISMIASDILLTIQPEVQEILDHYQALLGIRIALYSAGRQELRAGLNSTNCSFCRHLREGLDYEKKCEALDRKKQAEAFRKRKPVVYVCHGGMTEAIIPLVVDEQILGSIMIGQFRAGDARHLPSALRRTWRKHYGNSVLEEAWEQAPNFTADQLQHIIGLVEKLATLIVSNHLVQIKQHRVVFQVVDYLRSHVNEHLTLEHAAALAYCSASTLAHLFTRSLGVSFKQFQINLKLEQFEKLLQAHPDMNIGEAARRVGYEDSLYFSRLYRKKRGMPPSAYRDRCHTIDCER